jgi:hypothetical protein
LPPPSHETPTSHAASEPDAQLDHTALDMELMAEALLNEAKHYYSSDKTIP